MGRIDETLAAISAINDTTERALALAGFSATLFRLQGLRAIMGGQLAYDCYVGNINTNEELILYLEKGRQSPRIVLEVMRGDLKAQGILWDWLAAGVRVRILPDIYSEGDVKGITRNFNTDFGTAKLVSAEQLTADRILASIHPLADLRSLGEAKRLLLLGLSEALYLDWNVLNEICNSPSYRCGETLAQLRTQAQTELEQIRAQEQDMGVAPSQPPSPAVVAEVAAAATAAAQQTAVEEPQRIIREGHDSELLLQREEEMQRQGQLMERDTASLPGKGLFTEEERAQIEAEQAVPVPSPAAPLQQQATPPAPQPVPPEAAASNALPASPPEPEPEDASLSGIVPPDSGRPPLRSFDEIASEAPQLDEGEATPMPPPPPPVYTEESSRPKPVEQALPSFKLPQQQESSPPTEEKTVRTVFSRAGATQALRLPKSSKAKKETSKLPPAFPSDTDD